MELNRSDAPDGKSVQTLFARPSRAGGQRALDIIHHGTQRVDCLKRSRILAACARRCLTAPLAGAALLGWLSLALPASVSARDIAGRYFIVEAFGPGGADAPYGGTADITARRGTAYVFNRRPEAGKRQRGLGLREGEDLLGVSLNTGGAAYGLIVFRREDGGRRWHGRWLTSLDGGSQLGEMSFEADSAQSIAGSHTFTGRRGSTGGFAGTVTITRRGAGYLLNFTTSGGLALYRGLGALSGDRLLVGWSFGGSPSLAVYQIDATGLTGQRLTLPRASRGDVFATTERLALEGSEDLVFPPQLPAPGNSLFPSSGGASGSDELPVSAPAAGNAASAGKASSQLMARSAGGALDVKTLVYTDLMRRYGKRGQAERWLREQLTAEERQLLDAAIAAPRAKGARKTSIAGKTVAQLIDEQRTRRLP
jgi:hypothetical protein